MTSADHAGYTATDAASQKSEFGCINFQDLALYSVYSHAKDHTIIYNLSTYSRQKEHFSTPGCLFRTKTSFFASYKQDTP
jgi:hypothetical protein